MMADDDLERAKRKVAEQIKAANRRATLAERVRRWYQEQADQNGFREMIDAIIRGQE
jgi:hypothetical protein